MTTGSHTEFQSTCTQWKTDAKTQINTFDPPNKIQMTSLLQHECFMNMCMYENKLYFYKGLKNRRTTTNKVHENKLQQDTLDNKK